MNERRETGSLQPCRCLTRLLCVHQELDVSFRAVDGALHDAGHFESEAFGDEADILYDRSR